MDFDSNAARPSESSARNGCAGRSGWMLATSSVLSPEEGIEISPDGVVTKCEGGHNSRRLLRDEGQMGQLGLATMEGNCYPRSDPGSLAV